MTRCFSFRICGVADKKRSFANPVPTQRGTRACSWLTTDWHIDVMERHTPTGVIPWLLIGGGGPHLLPREGCGSFLNRSWIWILFCFCFALFLYSPESEPEPQVNMLQLRKSEPLQSRKLIDKIVHVVATGYVFLHPSQMITFVHPHNSSTQAELCFYLYFIKLSSTNTY